MQCECSERPSSPDDASVESRRNHLFHKSANGITITYGVTDMDTQGDRIRELRERAGLTQEELGRRVGTTKQTIFKYETGKIGNIPYSRLLDIATALGAEPWDILGWKQPLQEEEDVPGFISVPFISQKISAGYGEDFLSDDSITLKRIQIPESMARGVSDKSMLVSAEVKGDSMIDANIYPGDYVFFAKGMIKGEGIYVIAFAGDIMVKRLSFDAGANRLTIISENHNYPTRTVDADSDGVRILGKVIGWIHNEMF